MLANKDISGWAESDHKILDLFHNSDPVNCPVIDFQLVGPVADGELTG